MEPIAAHYLGENWFDPLEARVRRRIRGFIEGLLEAELDAVLTPMRYERPSLTGTGSAAKSPEAVRYRHGHRARQLMGTFEPVTDLCPPRPPGNIRRQDGRVEEPTIPAYQRRTKRAAYLAGTNTRRVRRALAALFRGAVSKDTVSRVWRKMKGDWDAWNARSLTGEPVIRLILDGRAVRVRLDRKAMSISLPVALGVRQEGRWCCWRSRTWAAKARQPGGRFSTISLNGD